MFSVEAKTPRVNLLRIDDGKVNAIGPAFVEAFPAAWARATPGGKAVVIAGNAKAFGAGLDLKLLPTLPQADVARFARGFLRVFADVLAHDAPVVAAVDGPALAGGAVLALCADLRLGTSRARLGVTEVPVGVPFPDAVLDLARDRLPPQEHAPAILGGWTREGADALRHGWLHELVELPALVETAVARADLLAQSPPYAFRAAKAMLNGTLLTRFERLQKDGADAWAAAFADPAVRQAVAESFSRLTRK